MSKISVNNFTKISVIKIIQIFNFFEQKYFEIKINLRSIKNDSIN